MAQVQTPAQFVNVSQDGWLPADNALLAACGDLDAYLTTNAAMVAGTLYLSKVTIRQACLVGHVAAFMTAAGVGASTGSFAGLYSSAGVLLTGSADQAAAFTAAAPTAPQFALTTPQQLNAGTFVWAALLVNLATSQPSLARNGGAGTLAASNMNLAAALSRFAVNGTGLLALPANITPSANTGTGAVPFWVGLAA